MKPWRLSPTRSATRRTEAVLREAWREGRWSYRKTRASLRLRSLPHLAVPATISIALLLPPLLAGVDRTQPSWLSDAWQVSGVLIGFALALFVFLMEALVDRHLRSSTTFRTVIRRAGVEWPLALGLAFIGYSAIGARLSTGEASMPAWAETWLLGVFLIQLGSFALVFGRGIHLVPPGAIATMIRRAFRDAAHEATRRQLRRRISQNLMIEASKEASAGQDTPNVVSYTPIGIGGPGVPPIKSGEIKDIDLALPGSLTSLRPAGPIGLTMALTDRVSPDGELARLDSALGATFAREVTRGVVVGRRSQDLEIHEIFREAIDFARRALSARSVGDLDLALDVIEGAFSEVATSWKAFGARYEASAVREVFSGSLPDRMYEDLRDLSIDFVNSGDPRFIQSLSSLSYRLMMAGYRHDAPLLVEHGSALSVSQASLLK